MSAASPSCKTVTWIELPPSHWPMWSRPHELAAIIGDVANGAAAARRTHVPHDRLRPELKGVTMHVLPLPFGLALALIPRREADKIRAREEMRPILGKAIRPREEFLGDVRSFYLRDHV